MRGKFPIAMFSIVPIFMRKRFCLETLYVTVVIPELLGGGATVAAAATAALGQLKLDSSDGKQDGACSRPTTASSIAPVSSP